MSERMTNSQLAEIIDPVSAIIQPYTIWRHKKSHGNYLILGVALAEGSQEPVVVYRMNNHGSIPWVRVARDFLDGRFVKVEDPQ